MNPPLVYRLSLTLVIPTVYYFRDSDGDNTVAEFIASFKFFPLGLRSVPAEKKGEA
jgi:hypothetical protein